MHQWKSTPNYRNDEAEGAMEIRIANGEPNGSQITGNRLYFYGDINGEVVLDWNRQLDDTSRNMKIMQTMYDLQTPPQLSIYIQSNGGEIFPALSVLGRIESLKNDGFEIRTIIDGFCASSATLISIGGSTRYIRKYSCMMIHQLSGGAWGTYSELKDEQQNIDLLMNTIRGVYNKNANIPESELNEILTHDLYLSAEECIAKKLVDKIL
jgi:ATP-dependent Clp protease, protease subunit